MTPEAQSPDIAQLSKLVAWIDEQRKHDKDQVARLTQQVDRLSAEARETTVQLVALHDQLAQNQTAMGRIPAVDASLRQIQDQLAELQRHLQEVEQRESRNAGLQQTEIGRATKSLADISQQLAELYRRDEAHLTRVQLLSEELKHDRAAVAPLPQQIEHGEKQSHSLAGRIQLVEEQLKRQEGQVASLGQADEAVSIEQKRLWQWQQSAELRWARQLAEWEQHMEQWQRLLDEQAKLIQDIVRDAAQGKDGIEAIRRELSDQHERLQSQLSDIRRTESTVLIAREEVNRLVQTVEAQRRRVDDQFGAMHQFEETLRQDESELAALGRRVDNERGRVDELVVSLRQREQEQRGDRGELEAFQQEVRSQRYEIRDGVSRLSQELAELRQQHRDRLSDVIEWHERSRARQIEELEQQLRELREQAEGLALK